MTGEPDEIRELIAKVKAGDSAAMAQLMELLYPELRRVAGRYMRGERPGHTLQPTALIHEVYIRLAQGEPQSFQDRTHFVATAAQVMRRLLIDHARAHIADKRGGGEIPLELKEGLAYSPEKAAAWLELEAALERLEQADPIKAKVVELKIFGGLTVEEIAEAMEISDKTVKRYWSAAQARLKKYLTSNHKG